MDCREALQVLKNKHSNMGAHMQKKHGKKWYIFSNLIGYAIKKDGDLMNVSSAASPSVKIL